jgi:hypothetical protein
MQQRIAMAVEIERLDTDLFAQRGIEGRRRLAPGAVDEHLGKTVPGEEVGAHALAQLFRGEVVAHVGKADARRDAVNAAGRRIERSLADAIAGAAASTLEARNVSAARMLT